VAIANGTRNRTSGIGFSEFVMLMSGILVTGVIALNLTVVRPLKQHLEDVQQHMAQVESQLQLVAAERGQARNVNDLLTLLKAQHKHVDESYAALKAIRQFRTDVQEESFKIAEFLPTLNRLVELENLMVQQRQLAEPAALVLDEIVAMQRSLLDQERDVMEAGQVLQRMAETHHQLMRESDTALQAQAGLEHLADLKRRILSQSRGTDAAHDRLDELAALKSNLIQETEDVASARLAAEELLNLKDQLALRGAGTHAARASAEQMISLRDRLATDTGASETANRNLERLLAMRTKLAQASDGAGSITLGVMTVPGVRDVFEAALAQLGIRPRRLLETVSQHSSLVRTLRGMTTAIPAMVTAARPSTSARTAAGRSNEKATPTGVGRNAVLESRRSPRPISLERNVEPAPSLPAPRAQGSAGGGQGGEIEGIFAPWRPIDRSLKDPSLKYVPDSIAPAAWLRND